MGIPASLALMVHDEAVFLVKEECATEFASVCEAWFRASPPWAPTLPLTGDAVIVDMYGTH